MRRVFLTFFYTGLSPKAPGTMGSLLALIFGVAIVRFLSLETLFLATILLSIIAAGGVDMVDLGVERFAEAGPHGRLGVVEDELLVEVHVRPAPPRRKSPDAVERVQQSVDLPGRGVCREAGSRRRGDSQCAVQRPGTVMTNAHSDPGVVEDLPDVVGMDPVDDERDHRAAHGRVARPRMRTQGRVCSPATRRSARAVSWACTRSIPMAVR